jgi:hypothetical protein
LRNNLNSAAHPILCSDPASQVRSPPAHVWVVGCHPDCPRQPLDGQLFVRDRFGTDTQGGNAPAPKGLISKEWHNNRWNPRPETGRRGPCATMMDDG